ncbi:condensation domain protein [Mycobacterium parascrofulaceum ATCC BAA-614]|uniref:Condensation domain protein n=1 Tax=Mycobacterium parascrofulaceum ATCC BAA-614 TaxID=525368 RepID=D5PGE7_9MYCO|nr:MULTISPECIES: GNAT family N-acetyltransferase [Mycobacterium]EFG74875.1 condensation domain protein [Mycobacterium parascrofulaceum ATCC BAA-614]OCB60375.1 peptide synthetase [Mycobacterium malmoense]
MRLTNVAHLRLPFGRLWGYDVSVSDLGRQLPVSFDQRIHVGAGARPGSWMALSIRLPAGVSRQSLADAWLAVIARHGTLRTAFTPGADGDPQLNEIDIHPGRWVEHEITPGQAVNDALRVVLNATCSPYQRPSHRLCVLETAAGLTVVIAADHAHVDMWSMLVIARDLLSMLADARIGRTSSLQPPPAFVVHTQALLDRPAAPDHVRARWAQIISDSGGVMPRFPLPLGESGPHPERVEVRDVFDVDDGAAFAAQARDDGVSTLALAVVAMTAVTRELAGAPLRAVFPVHSRFEDKWHDSVGWFITNSVLESAVAEPHAAATAVKEAVQLGSWPLADVLAPWGGMPIAPGMFAISWLDQSRLPVRIDSVGLDAQYVSASVDTDGVMLWFIQDESGLHLRCRYPDTAEARTNVGAWLDLLVARLQALAQSSVRGLLRVAGRTYRVQRATREHVGVIAQLLSDDEFGQDREGAELERYEAAYDIVVRNRSNYLGVVLNGSDMVVATVQLTIIPGLSRGGATRLQIEGLRVAKAERAQGLGTALVEWAHNYGRAHGAQLAQVTTDEARERARAFYRRLGYHAAHVGLKRTI